MAETEKSKATRRNKATEAAKLKAANARLATLEQRRDIFDDLTGAPGRQIHGFVDFIRERGVVGLAVGLAIGTAASGLVTQIVNAVVIPAVNLLVGKDGLKGWDRTISVGDRSEVFAFGMLIDALIKFLAIAAVIYFVVKGLKLDRLDKKKEE